MIHTIYETGGQLIHLDSCKERRNGDDKAHPRRIEVILLTKVAAYTLVFALCAYSHAVRGQGKVSREGMSAVEG